jgi:hypothetical protein
MAALTAITRFPGKLCFQTQCASSARRVPPNGHRISTCRAAPTSADGSRAPRQVPRACPQLLSSCHLFYITHYEAAYCQNNCQCRCCALPTSPVVGIPLSCANSSVYFHTHSFHRTLARRDLLLLGSLATGVALSSPDKAMAFTSDGV